MILEVCLQIAGLLLLALAAIHVTFPKRFAWKKELSRLSPLNRQMFLVHVLFILLVVIFMGVLSLVFTQTLIERSGLARIVLIGVCAFWTIRLFVQWFVYDRSLWRNDRFNTVVHYAFTCLWTYLAFVYGCAAWLQFT